MTPPLDLAAVLRALGRLGFDERAACEMLRIIVRESGGR